MPEESETGRKVGKNLDTKYATELARLTHFSEQERKDLFPDETDQEELKQLLAIVDNCADDNERQTKLYTDFAKVSGTVVKILKKAVGVA